MSEEINTKILEGATEAKTIQISGFTASQRDGDLQKRRAKMEQKGWTFQSYHDEGWAKSTATFIRPLHAGASARKPKTWLYALTAVLAVFVIVAISGGSDESPSSSKLLSQNLKAYEQSDRNERLAAIRAYSTGNLIPAERESDLYAFLSETVYTKDKSLSVGEVLGWAKAEMEANGGKLARRYVNLDDIKKQFSPWDGSHRKLEELVKRHMNDEDSYEHIETRYRLVLHGNGAPYLYLITTFSGKNAFGGRVKETISAKASIADGTILEVMQ